MNEDDMSKLRLYCPFMSKALDKAAKAAGLKKKDDKKKPQAPNICVSVCVFVRVCLCVWVRDVRYY